MTKNIVASLKLYRASDLSSLKVSTTKSIEPLNEIVGQDRAQKAVKFAMHIEDKGYNIYALGENGLGKRSMVMRYLNNQHKNVTPIFDWCYVTNFENSRQPKILKLKLGTGPAFQQDIEDLVKSLMRALPLAFDNENYINRSEELKNHLNTQQRDLLSDINEEAKLSNISLSITMRGEYQFMALNGDKPHTEESFNGLTDNEKNDIQKKIDALELKLRKILRNLAELENDFTDKIEQLNNGIAKNVLNYHIEPLQKKHKKEKAINNFLTQMNADILKNLDIFLRESEEQAGFAYATLNKKLPRRYLVNVLVHQEEDQFPIIVEDNPNYHSLFGYIENATYKGTVFTDFSLIRAGSMHKANGGVLLMDAIKVLQRPYVWDGLKRTLRAQQLSFNSLERQVTLSGAISLEPEAVPLNVKIILFGNYRTYQLLQKYDSEFKELFKVTADFANTMERNLKSETQYARFISSIIHESGFLHCDTKALERIIEHSARKVDHQDKLSLFAADITNLLRESDYIAKDANANLIRVGHVNKAIENHLNRVNKIQEMVMESYTNKMTLIATKGSAIGQVNALAVLATSDHVFGIANRITATTSYGQGEILDIERHVNMGGSIHSKGVMILSAYLRSIFAKVSRIPLTTTITFEQNYSGVDGDSASMAEVCAIISTYAKLPLKQNMAITGSMNQFGQAQPIGGINEKIEGFFDVCMQNDFTGEQGVVIPAINQRNLMLRQDIRLAVSKNKFHIWAVDDVSEALEILLEKKIEDIIDIAQKNLNALKR